VNQLDSTREEIAKLEARLAALSGGSTGISISGSPGAAVNNSGTVAGRDVVNSSGASGQQAQPAAPAAPAAPPAQEVALEFAQRPGVGGELETRITWRSPLFGREETTFTPPFDEEDLALVIRALDVLQFPSYPNAESDEEQQLFTFNEIDQQVLAALNLWKDGRIAANSYQVVGQALYQALGPAGQGVLKTVRNFALSQRQTTNYVYRFPANAVTLAALPWELLWDGEKNQAVLIRGNAIDSCERYVDIDMAIPPPLTGNQELHILALSPSYGISEDVRQQEQDTRNKVWNRLASERKVRLGEVTPLTVRALNDYLDEAPSRPDIVHYFGHGMYKDGKGYLLFDKPGGGLDLVSVERLAAILGDVRLVVINACQSAMLSELGGLLTGVAPALSVVVGSVVAMQLTVRIEAATRFVEIFYRELLTRRLSLQEAVSRARRTLFTEDTDGASWYVPTLYIRSREQEPVYLVS
jgi:hypothetical protein